MTIDEDGIVRIDFRRAPTPKERLEAQRERLDRLRVLVEGLTHVSGLVPEITSRLCLRRLLGKQCLQCSPAHDFWCEPHLPPGADHITMWRSGRRVWALVSQPYGMPGEQMQVLADLCDRYGFRFYVAAATPWWYDTHCDDERFLTVVVYRRREEGEG